MEAREAHMLRKKFRRMNISRQHDTHGEEKRSKSAPNPERPTAAEPSSRPRSQVPDRRSRNQASSRLGPDRHSSREQRVFSEQTARARLWPGGQDTNNIEQKCVRRPCIRLQLPDNDGYCDSDCRLRCLECDRWSMVLRQVCSDHLRKCASARCNGRADYQDGYCAPCFFRAKCLTPSCQKPNVPGCFGFCDSHVPCGKDGCQNVGLGSFSGCCSDECRQASPACVYHSCQRRGPGHKLRDGCCSNDCQSALAS